MMTTSKKMKRRPTHPGEILREEFMPDYGLTVSALAEMLKVSRQSVNELVRERRNLSADMAIRLSVCFGNSPEQWLNIQRALDIWEAEQRLSQQIGSIQVLSA
jgi:addiction module HigA family antidote